HRPAGPAAMLDITAGRLESSFWPTDIYEFAPRREGGFSYSQVFASEVQLSLAIDADVLEIESAPLGGNPAAPPLRLISIDSEIAFEIGNEVLGDLTHPGKPRDRSRDFELLFQLTKTPNDVHVPEIGGVSTKAGEGRSIFSKGRMSMVRK